MTKIDELIERIEKIESKIEEIRKDLDELYYEFENHTHYIDISTTTESPDW
jgi:uncharacterized protein (UPF0335 family)